MTQTQPGKFEGEPSWAPVLYDWICSGMQDDTIYDGETPVDVFLIDAQFVSSLAEAGTDADDVAELGGLVGERILLWETEQGFVETRIVDTAEYDRIEQACQLDADADA